MAHRCQVVNLVRLCFLDDAYEVRAVCHVAIMQLEPYVLIVWILIKVVNAVRIDEGRTAFNTVNNIHFFEEQFCEVSAVLRSDERRVGTECVSTCSSRWST